MISILEQFYNILRFLHHESTKQDLFVLYQPSNFKYIKGNFIVINELFSSLTIIIKVIANFYIST